MEAGKVVGTEKNVGKSVVVGARMTLVGRGVGLGKVGKGTVTVIEVGIVAGPAIEVGKVIVGGRMLVADVLLYWLKTNS
jgi:hypothetical protein